MSFRLGLAGGWNLPTFAEDDWSGLLLLGRMYFGELYDADGADVFYRILRGSNDPVSDGTVTDALIHTLDVEDGKIYGLRTWVISELRNSSGAGFASLAGLLSVTPGPGVSVTFADPAFLSDGGVSPAPVPLPAPFALLLTGVGAFGLLRKPSGPVRSGQRKWADIALRS